LLCEYESQTNAKIYKGSRKTSGTFEKHEPKPRRLSVAVRDLWTGKPPGKFKNKFPATTAPHAVFVVNVIP
jgi:hypothetical protein